MIAAVSSDLIQSEIALRTVSTQRHHPSRKMVDKGLEKVQEKNDVGQKLHKRTLPFIDGWIKNTAWGTDIQTTANHRGLSVAAQAAVWNIMIDERQIK